MSDRRLWALIIRDKVTGNLSGTYKIWAATPEEAFQLACMEDEHDAIPTGNYELASFSEYKDDLSKGEFE